MKARRLGATGSTRAAAGIAATVLLLVAVPAAADGPEGLWYADGGSAKVEIRRCGEALCGTVVWLRSPFDEHGCELRNVQNPEERHRERPVLGLEILRGLTPDGGARWVGGSVYDPGTGNTYRAKATLEGENRLLLRGYVGVPLLGRTTSWIRVGTEQEQCRAES